MTTATVTPLRVPLGAGARWQPHIGREAQGLVARKLPQNMDGQEGVLASSVSILSKSIPPADVAGSTTGLVVGYVQSGKTLSFTAVMALARDNGFQLVIVAAGTSKPLLEQSTRRIRQDLRIDDINGAPRWKLYTNPTNNENIKRSIQQTIDDWRDASVPGAERATVLITVMKQHRHLKSLAMLLGHLRLQGVPALVIDDEADQASLNTLVTEGRQSTTYQRLLEVREALEQHTYLQYTATPQAPLLINIIDALSPAFVEVLEPGPDYIGGKEFFRSEQPLYRAIPLLETPVDGDAESEPPPSLLMALKVFLVGVACGWAEGRSERNRNRSMLVHPSQRTDSHREYRRWIGDVFDHWQRVFALPDSDSDRQELLEEFREAHDELARTVENLKPFAQVAASLPRAFRFTRIEEVNARRGQTPIVDFNQEYGWILVGGQAMDRGFTVEGLTVTYMPRGPGVGNADTIQQRGRFFGYKRAYLGYCRVYLEQEAIDAFENYVEHEEYMRGQLQRMQQRGRPLGEWKRAFVLAPELRPCRNSVVQYDYVRGRYDNDWFTQSLLSCPESVAASNREVLGNFLASVDLQPLEGGQSSVAAQQHRRATAPLRQVIDEMLVPFRVTGAVDSSNLIGAMLQLSSALDDACVGGSEEVCAIYEMSHGYRRERTVNADGRSPLFQGPTRTAGGGYSYPGDAAFHDNDSVSVQIHRIRVFGKRGNGERIVIADDVPILAIWVPHRLAIHWVAQHQPLPT